MLRWGVMAGVILALANSAAAAVSRVDVQVVDAQGAPVADAVVSLHALEGGGAVPAAGAAPIVDAVIEQVRGEFNPRILVVTTGTAVRFPNLDRIRHHVYSFSPAKVFELPLYSGEAHAPVVFEEPGIVTLGCNIHDWMLGHLVVLDTPVFALSDGSGAASLLLPPGSWQLRVWHPRLPTGDPPSQREISSDDAVARVEVVLELSPPVLRRPGASAVGEHPP